MKTIIVGIVSACLGAALTYFVTGAKNQTQRSSAPDTHQHRRSGSAGANGQGDSPGRGASVRRLSDNRTDDRAARQPMGPETVRLTRRVARLQKEVRRLQKALAQRGTDAPAGTSVGPSQAAAEAPRDSKSYDLPEDVLLGMAERCELRWDTPSLGPYAPTIAPDDVAALGLSDEERQLINAAMATSHEHLTGLIQQVYGEITGDPQTGSMSTTAMLAEIRDKTEFSQLRAIFSTLARERAGLQAPPESADMPALERLFRGLTGEGDKLEQRIADGIGPQLARDYRDLHSGWSSGHRSSYGCPR